LDFKNRLEQGNFAHNDDTDHAKPSTEIFTPKKVFFKDQAENLNTHEENNLNSKFLTLSPEIFSETRDPIAKASILKRRSKLETPRQQNSSFFVTNGRHTRF
jgi:hypothetical protein